MKENSDTKWHVEKSIPLSTVAALVLQTLALVIWGARLDSRVSNLELQTAAASWQAERIIRLDERLNTVQAGITDIKASLQRAQDERRVK